MSNVWSGVSEYDRFGPWIDEVETPEDMPPLYRDYAVDLDAAQLVLKVPRNIARRDATADMDLYNHVLILDKTALTVLSRRTSAAATGAGPAGTRGYDVLVFPHTETVAIHDLATLLDGRLTVATSTGVSTTVRYNATTRAKISTLVDQVQAAMSTRAPSKLGKALHERGGQKPVASDSLGLGRADQLLVSEYLDARRSNPKLRAWASHGRKRVRPGGDGVKAAMRRMAHALSPMTVHGAVFSTDGMALEVFGRHAWLVRGKGPVHSAARLVVPLSAIDGIEVHSHETYPDVATITLRAGEWSTEMAVPQDSQAHRLFSTVGEDS